MPPTIGGDKETGIGDKEEGHQQEEMYPHQDMETPPKPNASTVEKRDTTHETAPRKESSPEMKGTKGKPTSSIYGRKGNRITKFRMPKNQTPWHQSKPNWRPCPSKTRCAWQKKWESHRIFPQPN